VKKEQPRSRAAAPQPPSAKEAAGGRTRVTAGASMHHDMAAATELSKNALARERYELIYRVIVGLIAVIGILIAGIVFLATRTVEPKYFAMDTQGRVRELTALSRPMPSNDQVLNWVSTAATRSYTLSFAQYQQQLDDVRHYFTPEGWRGFEEALRRAGFIENLSRNKFITTASPTAAPVISAEGLIGEAYAWRIQVPILVTYQSASTRESRNVMVEVTVIRRPETENPSGLGIAQFISR